MLPSQIVSAVSDVIGFPFTTNVVVLVSGWHKAPAVGIFREVVRLMLYIPGEFIVISGAVVVAFPSENNQSPGVKLGNYLGSLRLLPINNYSC